MMKHPYMLSILPVLLLPALAEQQQLIISNNATGYTTIANNIVHPTGDWTASNVSAAMKDVLFMKTTPQGMENFGNAASLSSVACSMGGAASFDYTLSWTAQVAGSAGSQEVRLSSVSVDWALLRLHNNTVIGTVTYDGEGVLHSYDLSFNYELSSADGSQVWRSETPITVTIGGIAERDNYMCSNSVGIYTDGVSFGDTPETVMSAAKSEIVFGPDTQVMLKDDTTYTLHLTLAGVKETETGLDFDLNSDVRTRYGWGVAHEWTYAAVGNIALNSEGMPSPTPEPATAALSLLAFASLAGRRKRA